MRKLKCLQNFFLVILVPVATPHKLTSTLPCKTYYCAKIIRLYISKKNKILFFIWTNEKITFKFQKTHLQSWFKSFKLEIRLINSIGPNHAKILMYMWKTISSFKFIILKMKNEFFKKIQKKKKLTIFFQKPMLLAVWYFSKFLNMLLEPSDFFFLEPQKVRT